MKTLSIVNVAWFDGHRSSVASYRCPGITGQVWPRREFFFYILPKLPHKVLNILPTPNKKIVYTVGRRLLELPGFWVGLLRKRRPWIMLRMVAFAPKRNSNLWQLMPQHATWNSISFLWSQLNVSYYRGMCMIWLAAYSNPIHTTHTHTRYSRRMGPNGNATEGVQFKSTWKAGCCKASVLFETMVRARSC